MIYIISRMRVKGWKLFLPLPRALPGTWKWRPALSLRKNESCRISAYPFETIHFF